MNPTLIKTVTAGGAVGERRIVKPDSTAGQYIVATAATELLFGVCAQPGGVAAALDRMDIAIGGLIELVAGGTIAAGDKLTSGAAGVAVTAAPATGVNNHIIGIAYEAAASGDVFRAIYAPSVMQG